MADMWEAHLRGEQTSLNPLGMVEALLGAMNHAASLHPGHEGLTRYTGAVRMVMHKLMVSGKGTRDLCGPTGLTTEAFVDLVADEVTSMLATGQMRTPPPPEPAAPHVADKDVDTEALDALFKELDTDGNGFISYDELKTGLRRLNILPRKLMHTSE